MKPSKTIASLLVVAAISPLSLHGQGKCGANNQCAPGNSPTKLIDITTLRGRSIAKKDIVDTAIAAGSIKKLAAALTAAGLVDALKGEGPFTVFAPTDEAFAKLPAGTVERLLKPENKAKLTEVLTYHVVAGEIALSEALAAGEGTTLQGSKVKIGFDNGKVTQEKAAPTKDIVDTAVAAGSFKTLAAALTAADLVDTLKGKGPFTVFAPTDEAFAKLPVGTVENLLKPENKARLTAILISHVMAGMMPLAKAVEAGEASPLQGSTLRVGFRNRVIKVGDATLVKADIKTSNGIIHVVDKVLMPTTAATVAPQEKPKSKDLLLIFTDSVSSNPSKLLEEMIFSKKEFIDAANENFVILKIENPRNTSLLSDEEREQNSELWKKYSVSVDDNAPTIFLCDKQGLPYAATGYRMGGVRDYLKHLDKLRTRRAERDAALKTAATAERVKTKALNTAKEAMNLKPELFATFYGDAMDNSQKDDTEN